jgi:hypothetical protein
MTTLEYIEEDSSYSHLVNADGFKIFYRPDEGDVGVRELYVVIPERGVSISVTHHDFNEGVRVTAAQGIHDTYMQSYDQHHMEINIPDGEKL